MRSFLPHIGWFEHPEREELVTLLQRGYFEAGEQAFFWLFLRPGDSFIDCGAHIGLYSSIACRATNGDLDLISIEANPDTFSFLQENLKKIAPASTRFVSAAVWNHSGSVGFLRSDVGRSAYSHVDFSDVSPKATPILTVSLDEIVNPGRPVSLIKIDVEGAEPEVLTGALKSIKQNLLPLMMIEFTEANLVNRGKTSTDLAKQLEVAGYELCEFCVYTLELVPFAVLEPAWYKNVFACLDRRAVNLRLASVTDENKQIALDVLARAEACSLFSELEELDGYKKSTAASGEAKEWALRTEELLAQERHQLTDTTKWARRTEQLLAQSRFELTETTRWAQRTEELLAQSRLELTETTRWAQRTEQFLAQSRFELSKIKENQQLVDEERFRASQELISAQTELSELRPFADQYHYLYKNYLEYKNVEPIAICICTHNPRLDILRKTIYSIAHQDVSPVLYTVVFVDNGSNPPLAHDILQPLIERGVSCKLVHEPKLGIAVARRRAIQETTNTWIVFVDDDNELNPDFLGRGFSFFKRYPDVGCFGGRILLPDELRPASWVKPFLPFLAIKDEGDEPIFGVGDHWGPWEPPTAGAWVHRKVLHEYLHRSEEDQRIFQLGRVGRKNLNSCEDSIMMRGSFNVGLKSAYVPELVLMHHLDKRRFSFRYLIRLMYAYGVSQVVLESILFGVKPPPKHYKSKSKFLKLLRHTFRVEKRKSFPFAIGIIAYHLGARREYINSSRRVMHD